jgi:hypothetical protein
MGMVDFVESGMHFGPFQVESIFKVEESDLYKKISKDVKISDFFLLRSNRGLVEMFIIEAKSSSPTPTNETHFTTYIDELTQKFESSLNLFVSATLGRHGACRDALPADFNRVAMADLKIVFILIVKGHKKEWLIPIKDKLDLLLKQFARTHALKSPYVLALNDTMARSNGFIR